MYGVIDASFRVSLVVYFSINLIEGDIAGHGVVKREQPTVRCSYFQFRCSSGQTCVDKTLVCDGLKDCPDGSDETAKECANNKCTEDDFRCSYGACVGSSAVCDGRADCADNSDESNADCPPLVADVTPIEICKSTQFKCIKSRKCIEKLMVCDGKADCDDGSDETVQQCGNSICADSTFRCEYGACINSSAKCNGRKDCLDGSDEFQRTCNPIFHAYRPWGGGHHGGFGSSHHGGGGYGRPKTSCVLPDSSNDIQIEYGCPEKTRKCVNQTEKKVDLNTELKHRCSKGYGSGEKTKEFLSVCWRGNWLPPVTRCKRTCKALKPENVDLTCSLKGSKVDCKGDLLEDTSVRPRCQAHHRATQPIHYRQIYCESNGQWTDQLFTCIPECGKPNRNVKKLIAKAEPEKYGESPWHVAIYNIVEPGRPQICGGTIISPHLVVSAAHCFFDESVQKLRNVSRYEVAVSKYSREYSKKDNRFTKMYKIREIILPKQGFTGFSTNYASDIAILWIKEKILMNRAVLPACIPWTDASKFNPGNGILGKLSGFGKTENGTASKSLLTAHLPYISREKCIKSLKDDFKDIVTLDKFCAGSETGAGAREGDSGGGLLFRDPDLGVYYLHGIVSIKDETSSSVALFTDLQPYLDWMDVVRIRVLKQAT